MAISIHAPRTGSDAPPAPGRPETSPYFNPRSPHGERHVTVVLPLGEGVFQSTLPARGATRHPHSRRYPQHHFNPRSPHGERPSSSSASLLPAHFNPRSPHGERLRAPCGSFRYDDFNPRSPHGERRPPPKKERRTKTIFQSTLPARGATCCPKSKNLESPDFNPRSPHGERRKLLPNTAYNGHFNPRSPHGERRFHNVNALRLCQFQSTLPARGATEMKLPNSSADWISIHAPRTGSDNSTISRKKFYPNFNPRSPHGERPDTTSVICSKS